MKATKRSLRTDAEIVFSDLGDPDRYSDWNIKIIMKALNLTRLQALTEAAQALEEVKYLGDSDAHMQMWNANMVALQKKIIGLKRLKDE